MLFFAIKSTFFFSLPLRPSRLCGANFPRKDQTTMIVTFLGTSAANAFPEAFCRCDNCQQARVLGGPSLRKRSSVLINEDLLIDLGPDIMAAAQIHACSLAQVQYCLQTHPHADHLDLSHLLSRSPEYGTRGAPCLHFYASPQTLERAARTFQRDMSSADLMDPATQRSLNLEIHPVEPFQPFTLGRYRVTAFPANHEPNPGALLYAVESGGQCIFYGADTASLPETTWQGFQQLQMRFDLVILDHTYGPDQPGSDHLSAHQVAEHLARMGAEGLLAPHSRGFATHIAHEGNPPHPALVDFAQAWGYEIAYDGLVVAAG
jgi:phosphoribosyl 1,2-cyclic phosphodiesterase